MARGFGRPVKWDIMQNVVKLSLIIHFLQAVLFKCVSKQVSGRNHCFRKFEILDI